MTEYQEKAIAAIEAQQAKVKERSPQWVAGEQLKDICRAEPHSAELIAQDLVTPVEAEKVLREFYGLPAAGEPVPAPASGLEPSGDKVLHLEDFF